MSGEIEMKKSQKPDKTSVWRFSKPGGKAEYERLTDEYASELTQIILRVKDIDEMLSAINKLIYKIKMEAYGIRTLTHKSRERESDQRLSLKRIKDLEEAKTELDNTKKKLNEKVFLTRKKSTREQEEILEVMQHYKTGEKLETADVHPADPKE